MFGHCASCCRPEATIHQRVPDSWQAAGPAGELTNQAPADADVMVGDHKQVLPERACAWHLGEDAGTPASGSADRGEDVETEGRQEVLAKIKLTGLVMGDEFLPTVLEYIQVTLGVVQEFHKQVRAILAP
jgi:hypothetical protein